MESISPPSFRRIRNPSFSNHQYSLSNPRLPLPPRRRQFQPLAATHYRHDYDVVVVGAGIIGLSIARHLLLCSPLSVAVVDGAVPCSGATGAGQGYIWMAHRTPGSHTWQLAMRSKQLWEEMVEDLERNGGDASELLGWKRTGTLQNASFGHFQY